MTFDPRREYLITSKGVDLRKFHDYKDRYVTRPPYQRKTVWSLKKKQALLDSLFRRYYVPKLVVREVRLSDSRVVDEIIDGQQRITTVQSFYANEIKLPKSLGDVSPELPNKTYEQLSVEIREFIDEIQMDTDRITNIEDPNDSIHQNVATEIFWRLQQGESLNNMEIAHARLASRVRNFLVKYADDIDFDYENYCPIDRNESKHNFFNLIGRSNDRMQHLAILARMLLIEQADGPADVRDASIISLIDDYVVDNGIGDYSYEREKLAVEVLKNLNKCCEVFENDPMVSDGSTVKELQREYLIISFYMLVRHLRKYYVLDQAVLTQIHSFFVKFHERWKKSTIEDRAVLEFSESRQQSPVDLEIRDRILRQLFFEHLTDVGAEILPKDAQRAFSEAQRIAIYRKFGGKCQECVREGKPEKEALVGWKNYEADHVIPHSAGGLTDEANAELLCQHHNRAKSDSLVNLS